MTIRSVGMAARAARLRQVAVRNAALLRALPAYLPRLSTVVDAIECPGCESWVSPRLFNPRLRRCRACLDRAVALRPWPAPTGGCDV